MSSRPFYITTAIDYVNGKPHLGHAYEKITTDVIARWRRMCGDDVRYLTGTDEHGGKIEKTAAEAGMSPQAYVDSLVPSFKRAWDLLDISYDRFIRTTDEDHKRTVVALLEGIHEGGHLFDKTYEGWYCTGCEGFKTEKDLPGGSCPDHPTRAPQWLEEQNLFFRLSAFTQPLLDHIEANPSFIEPAWRRNEVLGLIRGGLEDISISRSSSSVSWGIVIPFREHAVIWVWYDALINYLSGAGFGTDPELYARYWPADIHVIGKDITRFHCVIWPAMLMAAGVPLPKQIFAHGWVLTAGEKLSKSSGIVVDPIQIAERYGSDALRYFLTSQVTFGRDGEFSWDRFEANYEKHLAGGLGNLLSRSVSMAIKYCGGIPSPSGKPDALLHRVASEALRSASEAYDGLRLHEACSSIWKIVSACNEQIQHREPWKMAKDEAQREELQSFLYGLLECIRITAVLLGPVLPRKSAAILQALGEEATAGASVDAAVWGGLPAGRELRKPAPLFPRLDQLLT